MKSVNPATNQTIAEHSEHDDREVKSLLAESERAFKSWRRRSIEEREAMLSDLADVLERNTDEYAELVTAEMGKPIEESVAEIEKCAWVCEYYSERAAEHLQDERIGAVPGARTYVSYEPLGPILAVMPWNFPFYQVFRFAAPHLTAGNVGILKHASNVTGCAEAIEEIFDLAGYPDGVFSTLKIPPDRVEKVITNNIVKAVTLTGSTRAGRAVAETSGREIKKTVLELGGSDPFIVLDDAHLPTAAETAAIARTINSGQSCIAAKRFIVHTDVYDQFLEQFTERMSSLTIGDPTDLETDVGPQAQLGLMNELHEQVTDSVDAGATLHLGGKPIDREGNFYPPTILTDIPQEAPAATDELFGPVAAVFEVESEQEAVRVANDSQFGLGASIWTTDLKRGERLAGTIESGNVFVNQLVKSDPRVPFGGVKNSGYGTELSRHGIREFTNEKTVWVEEAGD